MKHLGDQFVQKRPAAHFSGSYVVLACLFVTCLVVANIIAVKIIALPFGLFTPAGIVIFPLSYLFGDVLTEVYGYASARRVIWIGFACNLVAVIAIAIAGALPAAPFFKDQGAYQTILGFTPTLLLASFCAFLVGEFLNSFVLAKLKIATKGRWLWTRTIGSTFIGEGADTVVFILIAFSRIFTSSQLLTAILVQWGFKVVYEIVATPVTYTIVAYLKRHEGLDTYDYQTNFNPFALRERTVEPSR
jgi:queuosine precursor transporter